MAPLAAANATENAKPNPGKGAPNTTPVAVREVNFRALPDVTRAEIAARPQITIDPLTGASPGVYAARKAQAARGAPGSEPRTPALYSTMPSNAASLATGAPQFNIDGNGEADCAARNPSDQALAIGDENQILQLNQDCLSVWSTAGKRLLGPRTLQAVA
jgi:hypothetical protein